MYYSRRMGDKGWAQTLLILGPQVTSCRISAHSASIRIAILTTLHKAVNDVISDKNVVNNIMNNSTGLHHIEFNGFAKRHWQTGYYPDAYGWCLGLFWGLGLYL